MLTLQYDHIKNKTLKWHCSNIRIITDDNNDNSKNAGDRNVVLVLFVTAIIVYFTFNIIVIIV